MLGPNIIRGATRLTRAHIRPVAKLSSDFRTLFNAQFKGPFTQADAHQKSGHASIAYDALASIRLRFQILNIRVGELADSGAGHASLRSDVRVVRNSTRFP